MVAFVDLFVSVGIKFDNHIPSVVLKKLQNQFAFTTQNVLLYLRRVFFTGELRTPYIILFLYDAVYTFYFTTVVYNIDLFIINYRLMYFIII